MSARRRPRQVGAHGRVVLGDEVGHQQRTYDHRGAEHKRRPRKRLELRGLDFYCV